jgi:hypothetical protein
VSRLPTEGSTRRQREPFALVFHAARGSGLNEQVYRLETTGLDPFDCFLVRLAPDGVGERYEAIYS